MKRTLHVLCLCLCLLSIPFPVRAGDTESNRESLKGVTAMRVVIEQIDAQKAPVDLIRDQIRTDVELKLRQAAITVTVNLSDPYLYVAIDTAQIAGQQNYIYDLTVQFYQLASLARKPYIGLIVATWELGSFGYAPTGAYMRTLLSDRLDEFLNAYLSVNPKR
jgi:hypothetical protein